MTSDAYRYILTVEVLHECNTLIFHSFFYLAETHLT